MARWITTEPLTLTGGVVVAVGSSDMAQAPGTSSVQASLLLYYTSVQAAGTAVELRDAAGTVLASYTPANQYQSALISTPGIQSSSVYTVYAGEEKLTDITLSGVVTTVSGTGQAITGGMGGNPGGRKP